MGLQSYCSSVVLFSSISKFRRRKYDAFIAKESADDNRNPTIKDMFSRVQVYDQHNKQQKSIRRALRVFD